MQKAINIISIILVIICAGVSFIYYNGDLDINIPYLPDIFTGIGAFLILLLLIKITSRWQALFLGVKSKGYNIATLGFRKIIVYEGIMLLYYMLFAYVMFFIIDIGFLLGLAVLLFFIEGFIYLSIYLFAKPYKVLINQQSITLIVNSLILVKWSEIKKIDSRQNDIHLILDTNEPVLIDLDWFTDENKIAVIEKITSIAQQKNIYCSIDCKGSYRDFTKLAKQRKFED